MTLSWNAVTDNATTPVSYEILKDDPTFGTIVVGSTFERSYTDTGVTGTARYFVRSVDATGNRSATTPVISVTPPPPAAATLIAHGATWSYRADGQDLGSSWSQPAFNSSAWPTGASQLGWGGKGETTVIPSGPVTSYFVKHQNIADPGLYQTFTIRLKRDDGAVVYVNGLPVVRDNLPAGALTASTPASSFTSGTGESTWYEYQVPASLFTAGDNTIAVELHQGDLNNADAIFDLELVARNGTETNAPSAPAPTVTNVSFSSATLGWAAVHGRHRGDRLHRPAQRQPGGVHPRNLLRRHRPERDHRLQLQRDRGRQLGQHLEPGLGQHDDRRQPGAHRLGRHVVVPRHHDGPRHGLAPARLQRLLLAHRARPSSAGAARARRPSCP